MIKSDRLEGMVVMGGMVTTALMGATERMVHQDEMAEMVGLAMLDKVATVRQKSARAPCHLVGRDPGTALIGVQDKDKPPVGIARDLDRLKTLDAFQRKVQETFGVKLKPDPSDLIRITFPMVGDLMLAKIDITPDPQHAYELNGEVYVRRDGESKKLSGVDLTTWWTRRGGRSS